jgi:hypothetical protein
MDIKQSKNKRLKDHFESLFAPVSINPLIIFRVAFGIALFIWSIGMIITGQVYYQFVEPHYFFHYRFFNWVQPVPEFLMYLFFIALSIAAVFIAIGWYFRITVLVFTVILTYLLLIDKSNYLSYYYFMLLLLLMLLVSPAHRMFSLDIIRKPNLRVDYIPRWCILAFQVQVIAVFYFAGMAKLNSEWLFRGIPVNIWIEELLKNWGVGINLPLLSIFSIVISWILILYDFLLPHFLLDKKTSTKAYLVIIFIQLFAFILFPVGYFPFLIIFSSVIFLNEKLIFNMISRASYFLYDVFEFKQDVFKIRGGFMLNYRNRKLFPILISLFFLAQVVFPVALFLKWGSKRWATSAFQFSWQLFINHKRGDVRAWYYEEQTGNLENINLMDYLTAQQKRRMLMDPNLIVQFIEFLNNDAIKNGKQIKVYASLSKNGSKSILLIDPQKELEPQLKEFPNKKEYE